MAAARRRRVAMALAAGGALVLLTGELYLFSPDVRAGSVSLWERMGAWGRLAALLDDPDEAVRVAAGNALVRAGEAGVPQVVALLKSPSEQGRVTAAYVLGRIGPPAVAAVPALKARLAVESQSGVRSVLARALGQVGREDPELAAALVGMLTDGDEAARSSAAEALGAMGGTARGAVPHLARALQDPSALVRGDAAEALRDLAEFARPAIPALVEALEDPDPEVREESLKALGAVVLRPGEEDTELSRLGREAREKALARLSASGQPPH